MANRRVKLIWGGPETQSGEWKLGLWGTHERNPGSRIKDVTISGRGILKWISGLALAAYLAGTAVLYFWFERRPHNYVTYTDTLLLPWRWQRVQELRGRGYIEQGLEDMKGRRWADALMMLRLGLAKYPRDLRARLALSMFYKLSDRRPLALQTLREGLPFGYPGRSYIAEMFKTATEGEDFDLIVAVCDQFMSSEKSERTWLLAAKLRALIGANRFEAALGIAEQQGLERPDFCECRVMALLGLARYAEAAKFLDAWLAAAPSQRAVIVRLQVRVYRELRQFDRMERALGEFRNMNLSDPMAHVYGIVQRALAGQRQQAAEALENYILHFGGIAANLDILGDPLSEARQPQLLQRCLDEAAAHGFSTKLLKSYLAVLCMQEGNPAEARRLLDELKPKLSQKNLSEMFWMDWAQHLITVIAAPADSPAVSLTGLLQSRPLSMKIFRVSSTILIRADRLEAARAVLNVAGRNYPASSTLAVMRQEIDQAMQARQPKPVEATVAVAIDTEKTFFLKLTAAEQVKKWAEAAQAIRAIRAAKPGWLPKREPDVLSAQMRVALETGDFSELLAAARLFLDGSTERSQRVVGLARSLHERGASADAVMLLNEIFRRSPDFPPARRLRTEWEPEPKPNAKPAGKSPAKPPGK